MRSAPLGSANEIRMVGGEVDGKKEKRYVKVSEHEDKGWGDEGACRKGIDAQHANKDVNEQRKTKQQLRLWKTS